MTKFLIKIIVISCICLVLNGISVAGDETETDFSKTVLNEINDEIQISPVSIKSNSEIHLKPLSTKYNKILQHIEKGQSTLALEELEQFLDTLSESKYTWWFSRIYLDMGLIFYNEGKFDKALNYFLKSFSLSKSLPTTSLKTEAINYVGKYYHSIGDFKSSYSYFNKSLLMATKLNDTINMISAMNSLCKHYSTLGNYEKALELGLDAMRLQAGNNACNEIYATTCNYLGGIYLDLKVWPEALKYHKQALSQRQSQNNHLGIGKSLLNIGKVYFNSGNTDSSAFYFQRASIIFQELHYTKGQIKVHLALGNIATLERKTNEANSHFSVSLQLSERIGYIKGEINALIALGELKLELKEFAAAKELFEGSLNKSKAFNLRESMMKSYKGIQNSCENLGRFEEANYSGNQYADIREEILKSYYDKQLTNLHHSYIAEQKEKQNQILKNENQLKTRKLKQKSLVMWLIFSGLLFATILLVVIFIRFKQKQKAAKKLAYLNSELLKVSREKDKLFSIIAHEIRNPLWWFKNITEMLSQKFDEMSRENLSHSLRSLDESAKNTFLLMDNLLHWTRSQLQVVPHKPEQLNVNKLIEQNVVLFQSLCLQKKIILLSEYFELPSIFADKEQVNTVFRNLISNAIKFTPSGGLIRITAEEKNGFVQITVADNGIGMESTISEHIFSEDFDYSSLGLMQEKGSGIGLKLCKEFVSKNGGAIFISSKTAVGTTIEFSFPTLNKYKQIQALPKTTKSWQKRKLYKAKVS